MVTDTTVKVLTWFKRKPGLTLEDFRAYWYDEHPKAVQRMPGLVRYHQNHVTDGAYTKGEPFCDGVAETWWESAEVLRSHRDSPHLAGLLADEDVFIDPNNRQSLVVDEIVIVDGEPPEGSLKQFTWIKRRPDLSLADFQAYWRGTHGPIAGKIPGVVRYVQNHASVRHYGERTPPWDGLPIVHLAGMEAARAAARSPELAATRADEPNFIDTSNMPFVVATVRTIL